MMKLSPKLRNIIRQKAEQLKDFILSDLGLLGQVAAEERLQSWCENFQPHLPNPEVLCPLIDKIKMITDQEIMNRAIKDIASEFGNIENQSIFLCCFGGVNESSARIMRILNTNLRFFTSIEDTLNAIESSCVREPVIVFVDDFLNSGGQFESIIKTWMGAISAEQPQNLRSNLSKNHISLLMKCRLRFYFYLGMQTGRKKAENAIKKYGLNATIVVFEQYDDQKGIFGDPESVKEIRAGLEKKVSDTSIFKDFPCHEVKPLLKLCEEVGEAFLRETKPTWENKKLQSRKLGYGNSAQLFLTSNNVPSSTLTCLWAHGEFKLPSQAAAISWRPLLNRREKNVGSESAVTAGVASPLTPDSIASFDLHIDSGKNRDSSLEIMLSSHIPILNAEILGGENWLNETHEFLNPFKSGVKAKFSKDAKSTDISISHFTAKPESLFRFNDRPFYIADVGVKFPIKKVQASITRLGNACFAALRFKFITSAEVPTLTIKETLKFANKMSQVKQGKKKTNCVITKAGSFSIPQIFKEVFAMPDTSSISSHRLKIFMFARLDHSQIGIDNFNLEELAPAFKKFKVATSQAQNNYMATNRLILKMDYGAIVTASNDGSAAICTSEHSINHSYLQNRFLNQYYFLNLVKQAQDSLAHYPDLESQKMAELLSSIVPDSLELDKEKAYFELLNRLYKKS